MRRKIAVLVAGLVAIAAVSATALAVIPGETPFPSATVESVFVSTETVTGPTSPLGANILSNFYARGATVVFKVFAADVKSGKVLTADDVKYAYVRIPGQPNVKLSYTAQVKKNDPTLDRQLDGSRRLPAGSRGLRRPGSRRPGNSTGTSSSSRLRPRN